MSDREKCLLAACLACGLALALLASAVFQIHAIRHIDARLLTHVSADRFGGLGDVAHPIADLGNPVPQVLLLIAGLTIALRAGRRDDAVAGLILVAGANLTTLVLKHALAAPRLDPALGWGRVGETSFPSGHATAAYAMAGAWALFFVPPHRRLAVGIAAFVLASLVAAAVVILHYHFPSDVLGGLLVATAWACGVLAVQPSLPRGPRAP